MGEENMKENHKIEEILDQNDNKYNENKLSNKDSKNIQMEYIEKSKSVQ